MGTRRTFWAACLLLTVASVAVSQESGLKPGTFKEIGTGAGKMIVIDGQEHPEAIPDYSVWTSVFFDLAHAKESEGAALHPQLRGMPEGDLQALFREAVAQKRRTEECGNRTRSRFLRRIAGGATEAEARKEGVPRVVACRQEMLDAADRVLAELTPEGHALLMDYVQRKRTTMSIHIPAAELDLFGQPR